MEQRHTEIKEGAGLEESRINYEFVEQLQKWGPRALMVVAAIAAIYAALQWRGRVQAEALDAAFEDLYVQGDVSQIPGRVIDVARNHANKGAVEHLARLKAADILHDCARLGVTPEARIELYEQPGWDGTVTDEEKLATEDDIADYLAGAREQYQLVFDSTWNKDRFAEHAAGAFFGLAAVAETAGDEDAPDILKRAADYANERGFTWMYDTAIARLENNDMVKTAASEPLLTRDDIYQEPAPEAEGITTGRKVIQRADGTYVDEDGNPITVLGGSSDDEELEGPMPEGTPQPDEEPSVAPDVEEPAVADPLPDDEPSADPETP